MTDCGCALCFTEDEQQHMSRETRHSFVFAITYPGGMQRERERTLNCKQRQEPYLVVSSAVELIVEVLLVVMVAMVSVVDDDRMEDAAVVVVGRLGRM